MPYSIKVDAFGHAELTCECVSCKRSEEKAAERVCHNKECGAFYYAFKGDEDKCPMCGEER